MTRSQPDDQEQLLRDAPEQFKELCTVWATSSDTFKQFLRESPEQFELLYALWAMCSDALCLRVEEAYQTIGHPRPHGSCLFEVQLYLLASIVDLMDVFEHEENTIKYFIQFACRATAVDLHPRLLTNTDLPEIALRNYLDTGIVVNGEMAVGFGVGLPSC